MIRWVEDNSARSTRVPVVDVVDVVVVAGESTVSYVRNSKDILDGSDPNPHFSCLPSLDSPTLLPPHPAEKGEIAA